MSAYREAARRVFEIEIESLGQAAAALDDSFDRAVGAILECRGKVIVTGLGKSGAVGRKIAATLSSTGTPAVFLHASEGAHGDIGIIDRGDLVLAISYSGQSDELAAIIPSIKRLGVTLIAMTGGADSPLAKAGDILLPVVVEKEACPLGLAPTSSTTATLVMGDALAVAVYEARGFTAEDFAFRHPGGALGRSLLRVSDLMHAGDEIPSCPESASMRDVIVEMTKKKLGMTCIVDTAGALAGIITDGDLRRIVTKASGDFLSLEARSVLSPNPRTVSGDALAVQALTLMEERKITSLIVADETRRPVGVIHIHDILRSKVV